MSIFAEPAMLAYFYDCSYGSNRNVLLNSQTMWFQRLSVDVIWFQRLSNDVKGLQTMPSAFRCYQTISKVFRRFHMIPWNFRIQRKHRPQNQIRRVLKTPIDRIIRNVLNFLPLRPPLTHPWLLRPVQKFKPKISCTQKFKYLNPFIQYLPLISPSLSLAS